MWRLIFLFFFPISISAQLKRFEFTENKMGSPFRIVFYCEDSTKALQLSHQCYAMIDSLNNIYSDYNLSSEIGKLSSTTTEQNVSNELFDMLIRSRHAWKRSGKTFDITIGALTKLWRTTRNEKRFPTPAEIELAKESTGFKNLKYDIFLKTISFKKPGMSFDFGGIVKGYAAQKIVDNLKSRNINFALVDAGGDIVVSEAAPGKNNWTIAINLPGNENEMWEKKLALNNCAVATSGDIYRYTLHDGKKYSHIIDPLTGYGVTTQRNVTVIAKDGATSDWVASACSILPIKKALKLAKKENAELMIAALKNEKIITYKTKNFDSYFENSD